MKSSRREGLAEEQTRGPEIGFVVGNTYEVISLSKAKQNRDGTKPKIHDWILYVDVFGGDAGIIEYVKFDLPPSFQPSVFSCYYPVKTILPDSSIVLRFKTRQQSAKGLSAMISIFGIGGTTMKMKHKLVLSGDGVREDDTHRLFTEERPTRPLCMVPLPSQSCFAINLNLLCSQVVKFDELACIIGKVTGDYVTTMQDDKISRSSPFGGWKILVNNKGENSYPEQVDEDHKSISNCFRIVSPMLHSNVGFEKYKFLLRAFQRLEFCSVDFNSCMQFQVQVDVSKMTLAMLIKVCQNFIKYEEAIDAIMPLPRISNSADQKYILSNKEAVLGPNYSNLKKHKALYSCSTKRELVDLMNPKKDADYRLDLRSLLETGQPTILEFHQKFEKTTFDEKVHVTWVAFCLAFVYNSARFRSPSSLHESRSIDDQFGFLFEYVIKDRALEQIYKQSRKNNSIDKGIYIDIFSDSEEEFFSDLGSECYELYSEEEVTVVEDDLEFDHVWEDIWED